MKLSLLPVDLMLGLASAAPSINYQQASKDIADNSDFEKTDYVQLQSITAEEVSYFDTDSDSVKPYGKDEIVDPLSGESFLDLFKNSPKHWDGDADSSFVGLLYTITIKNSLSNTEDDFKIYYNTARDTTAANEDYVFMAIVASDSSHYALDTQGKKVPSIFGKPLSLNDITWPGKNKGYIADPKYPYMFAAHDHDRGNDDEKGHYMRDLPGIGGTTYYKYKVSNDVFINDYQLEGDRSLESAARKIILEAMRKSFYSATHEIKIKPFQTIKLQNDFPIITGHFDFKAPKLNIQIKNLSGSNNTLVLEKALDTSSIKFFNLKDSDVEAYYEKSDKLLVIKNISNNDITISNIHFSD